MGGSLEFSVGDNVNDEDYFGGSLESLYEDKVYQLITVLSLIEGALEVFGGLLH